MSLYIYHSKRIISVFRLQPVSALYVTHNCLQMLAELKCCAFNSFTSGFRCRWAIPGDRQRGGWPWQPLMSFDGRVAESSRVPHRYKTVILYKGGFYNRHITKQGIKFNSASYNDQFSQLFNELQYQKFFLMFVTLRSIF
jgi:hypothetical protein